MRSDLLSQDRPRGLIPPQYILPWSKNRGENMEDAIKDLSIEELMKIVELAQKEIDRRTIKVVD
jgi:hypothetical protein